MTLGERMKEYEMQSRTRLLRRTPVIIRLDGRAFHTWTRGLERPFDEDLTHIMRLTTLKLCQEIQGCVLGYTQSDEITLVLVDYQNKESMAWFDNQVQKITSVAASIATSAFEQALNDVIEEKCVDAEWYQSNHMGEEEIKAFRKAELLASKRWKANFDARAFNLPIFEVENVLIWRQLDAIRNSILSLGQSLYSHKELQGIKCDALQKKMLEEKNVDWNDLDNKYKVGTCVIKNNDGEWIVDNETPNFLTNREYIRKLIDFN